MNFMSEEDWKEEQRLELVSYRKELHYQLLAQKQEGANLTDELKSKLQNYSVILVNQLQWEVRHQYFELVDKYIKNKIGLSDFYRAFLDRYESIDKVSELLESNRVFLSPDPNSLDFVDLLATIEDCCRSYSDDPEPYRNDFEITSVQFRTLIEKVYFEMKKFLEEK